MKKDAKTFLTLLVVLLGFSFAVSPSSVAALTSGQIQAIIALVRSFGVDESVIKNVDDSLNGRTPTATVPTAPEQTFCYNWTRNLRIGDQNDGVTNLYRALIRENLFDKDEAFQDGRQVLNFDERLASAISEFQEKYAGEILTPNRLRRGNGYVGPSTRAKLNRLYGCGNTDTSSPVQSPPTASLYPPSAPVATPAQPTGCAPIQKGEGLQYPLEITYPNSASSVSLNNLKNIQWKSVGYCDPHEKVTVMLGEGGGGSGWWKISDGLFSNSVIRYALFSH